MAMPPKCWVGGQLPFSELSGEAVQRINNRQQERASDESQGLTRLQFWDKAGLTPNQMSEIAAVS